MMMMMHRSVKNIGLSSVLLLSSSQKHQASKLPLLAVESRLLLLSDHVGGGVCSPAAAAAAAAMGRSRRFFHTGGGGAFLVEREPTKTTTKKECQIISSSSLQRETDDDDISNSTKVSLNQFPGLMAPHSPQFGLTPSEIMNWSKTRRLLRLNPGTGYFEEQQDVAAAAAAAANQLQVPYGHVCRGSAYGWLFLTDDNLDMKLLNPFSGEEIQLPPVKTLPPSTSDKEDRWPLSKWFVRKAVFSANPSIEPRPVVLVTYGGQHIPRLAFCKPGDEEWTPLEFPEGNSHQDAIYHKGQFYVLSFPGYVTAYDIGRRIDDDDHSVKMTLVATPSKMGRIFGYDSYLVVVDGELVRLELRQRCFCDDCKEGTLKAIEIESKRDGDTTDEDSENEEGTLEMIEIESKRDGDTTDEDSENEEGTLEMIEIESKRDGDTTDEDSENEEVYSDEVLPENEEVYSDEVLPCIALRLCEVFPCIAHRLCDSTYGIKIRRLDVSKKQWVKMESLGDDKAVFVGYNTSFALSASDYPAGVCIPDSIYFTPGDGGNEHTEKVCYEAGIFNVKDKSVKPLYPPLPIDGVIKPPPIWIDLGR